MTELATYALKTTSKINYDPSSLMIVDKTNLNILWGNTLTGEVKSEEFADAFKFQSNLSLKDFLDPKMFPRGTKPFLNVMSEYYDHRYRSDYRNLDLPLRTLEEVETAH